jgi:hypothetical protein
VWGKLWCPVGALALCQGAVRNARGIRGDFRAGARCGMVSRLGNWRLGALVRQICCFLGMRGRDAVLARHRGAGSALGILPILRGAIRRRLGFELGLAARWPRSRVGRARVCVRASIL